MWMKLLSQERRTVAMPLTIQSSAMRISQKTLDLFITTVSQMQAGKSKRIGSVQPAGGIPPKQSTTHPSMTHDQLVSSSDNSQAMLLFTKPLGIIAIRLLYTFLACES